MFDLLSDDLRRDPYPVYDQLRRVSPVLHDVRSNAWLLFDYDSVKRALTDLESFSSVVVPPGSRAPDWLVFNDPPKHTQRRALIMRAFTPRSIESLEPTVRELSRELLAPLIERGEMDLATDYAGPLPTMVIAAMLGAPEADRARLLRWSEIIIGLSYSVIGGAAAEGPVRAYFGVRQEMFDFVVEQLARRRTAPGDDLLTRLAEAEVDGERLTDEEIFGFFQLLLSAGTETTTNVIDNGVLCLLEHPDQLALLRSRPALMPKAVEEIIRFRSPGQMMFRRATQDVVLHGRTIPAGAFVLPVIGSANRDRSRFVDPDRFDITRDPNPHIAFGHGVHFCIGAALARLEARVALQDLLDRLEDIALASDEPWAPRQGLHVHGPRSLPIRFRARGREVVGA